MRMNPVSVYVSPKNTDDFARSQAFLPALYVILWSHCPASVGCCLENKLRETARGRKRGPPSTSEVLYLRNPDYSILILSKQGMNQRMIVGLD